MGINIGTGTTPTDYNTYNMESNVTIQRNTLSRTIGFVNIDSVSYKSIQLVHNVSLANSINSNITEIGLVGRDILHSKYYLLYRVTQSAILITPDDTIEISCSAYINTPYNTSPYTHSIGTI